MSLQEGPVVNKLLLSIIHSENAKCVGLSVVVTPDLERMYTSDLGGWDAHCFMNVHIVLTGRLLMYRSANDKRPSHEYSASLHYNGASSLFEAAQAIGTSIKYCVSEICQQHAETSIIYNCLGILMQLSIHLYLSHVMYMFGYI